MKDVLDHVCLSGKGTATRTVPKRMFVGEEATLEILQLKRHPALKHSANDNRIRGIGASSERSELK